MLIRWSMSAPYVASGPARLDCWTETRPSRAPRRAMLVLIAAPTFSLDLQPSDERTALEQRLDQYRGIVLSALSGVPWDKASTRLLPSTAMTIAGIVKHLAWVAARLFQGRCVGWPMPAPWDRRGTDGAGEWMRGV